MNWMVFFLDLLKSILFSSGGYGPLPSIHSDFISQGLASQKQFTDSLAIGQVTPGPNGFWIISLCYLVGGLKGALLACIALIIPPLLILIVQHFYTRIAGYAAVQGLLDGLVLVVSSFSVIVVFQLFVSNGIDIEMVAIAIISTVLAVSRRVSANVILLVAAVIGLVFVR